MEIEKNKKYEIIVFPNQDEGLKAQRILAYQGEDFKHISTLAVVVPEERRQEVCRGIIEGNALISGYYPFLYRDNGAHFESFCSPSKSLHAKARHVASPHERQLVLGSQP